MMSQERLKAQREEAASNPEYGSSYKPKASKEERTAKRKQILSNIGAQTVPVLTDNARKPWLWILLFPFLPCLCSAISLLCLSATALCLSCPVQLCLRQLPCPTLLLCLQPYKACPPAHSTCKGMVDCPLL